MFEIDGDAAADPTARALMGTVVGLPAPASLTSTEWLDLTGATNADTADQVDPVNPDAALPQARLSTLYLDFGGVATNTTETRQVILSNPGTGVLVLTAPSLSASSHEAFTPLTTKCGTSLAVNESCLTEVSFSPVTVGEATGLLSFSTNAAVEPVDVEVRATAFNPVSLEAKTLPTGMVGRVYAPFSFSDQLRVSNDTTPTRADVTWQVSGALPAGLSLSPSGVLSGTPTATTEGAGSDFTVLATYKLNQSQRAYTLRVEDAVLSATQVSISTNVANYNLFTAVGSPTAAADYIITIEPSVVIYALAAGTVPAFTTGALPAGSTVKIINRGAILGMGGSYSAPGGPAIQGTVALTIDNAGGLIYGGGGGGASWGGAGAGSPGAPTAGIAGVGAPGYWTDACTFGGVGGNYGEYGGYGRRDNCSGGTGPGIGGAGGAAVAYGAFPVTWIGSKSTGVKGGVRPAN